MTFADVDVAFQAKKLDDWDRAAFVAERAYNANPFLRKWAVVRNPYRNRNDEIQTVDLADVPGLD